ncbi:MAG TPA: pentapeptide repeat-containing protein [Rubricoccaceae bacterium]|jgi:Tfp pilus assembly protein PilN
MSDDPLAPGPDEFAAFDGSAFDMPAFSGAAFTDAAFTDAAFTDAAFDDAAFTDAPFTDAAFEDAAFADVPLAAAPAQPPPAAPGRGRKARAARTSVRSKDALLLGLHVTPRQVFGVLVRPTGDGYEPLRQFVRNRTDGSTGTVDAGGFTPDDLDSVATGDVQFGGVGQVDFSAEFAGMGSEPEMSFDAMLDPSAGSQAAVRAQPVVYEIRDILEECEQAGFARPALAFTVGSPDVEYAEIAIAPETRKNKAAAKPGKAPKAGKEAKPAKEAKEPKAGTVAPVKRERLMAELVKEFPGADRARTAFVPMTPRDGHQRYFAVMPSASEPVAPSLFMLREQSEHRKTALRTLEAEVPLLVGLARLAMPAEPSENTALVRVGSEDTIVLLLSGGQLHHYEMMQSVTAFDGPDTICSRVLLQQDVQGIGTVHNVIVMAEERERELVQGFAAFYPEARVETLREGMARLGLVGPYGPLAPSLVEATGAALAGHLRPGRAGSPFEDANLLPEALKRTTRKISLAFAWHTLVVAVLLFMSVLYFMYTYTQQKAEIAAEQQRLAEFPPETRMSAPELQARIDSLNTRKAELTATLVVLDSLLIDTDLWTQTLLRTTRAAAQTGGVWIEDMTPNGAELQLHGYATSRSRVVGVAQRLEATINEVTFQALREIPVFEYRMTIALPHELPQIARVMREAAGEAVPAPAPLPLAGLSGTPTPATPASPPAAPAAAPAPAPAAPAAPDDPPAAPPAAP